MKKVLVGCVLFIAGLSTSYAGDFRDAASICETMSFSSNKNTCVQSVRGAEFSYFDMGAIEVCKSMSFDNGKLQCLGIIPNKTFESFEISNCMSQSFDSQKNQCLSVGGRAYQARRPDRPDRPRPPRQEDHSNDYENGDVWSWEVVGTLKAPKAVPERFVVSLDSRRAVVKVRLSSRKAEARVLRAQGVTASGKLIELPELEGSVLSGSVEARRLRPRYAVRLQRIELEIVSPNPFGSRAQVEVLVGYTR